MLAVGTSAGYRYDRQGGTTPQVPASGRPRLGSRPRSMWRLQRMRVIQHRRRSARGERRRPYRRRTPRHCQPLPWLLRAHLSSSFLPCGIPGVRSVKRLDVGAIVRKRAVQELTGRTPPAASGPRPLTTRILSASIRPAHTHMLLKDPTASADSPSGASPEVGDHIGHDSPTRSAQRSRRTTAVAG